MIRRPPHSEPVEIASRVGLEHAEPRAHRVVQGRPCFVPTDVYANEDALLSAIDGEPEETNQLLIIAEHPALTTPQREAIALYVQHLSVREIAERLRVSRQAVEQRIDAGLKRIRAANAGGAR